MNKEQAISQIHNIQRGGGASSRNKFPEKMKGNIARRVWEESEFSYGFEYGEIYGLMEAFDIKKEDL
jgi:hypothetical protein